MEDYSKLEIDIDEIVKYKNQFRNGYKTFNRKSYRTFSNSCIRYDNNLKNVYTKLNNKYKMINSEYSQILKWFEEYIEDYRKLEKKLSKKVDYLVLKKVVLSLFGDSDKSWSASFEDCNIIGYYGVDQGVFYKSYINGQTKEYNEIKIEIMNRYGLSNSDAIKIIGSMDTYNGICTYSETANEIFAYYNGRENEFERDFGFSMYKNVDGNLVFNSYDLLMDLYIYSNSKENGGQLFQKSANGYYIATDARNDQGLLNTDKQVYLSADCKKNDIIIDSYLKSKNPNCTYKSDYIVTNEAPDANVIATIGDEEKKKMKNAISDGKYISLGIYDDGASDSGVTMKNLSGGCDQVTSLYNGFAHLMFVTKVQDDGVIVSSWGEKYFISYDDLKNVKFTITEISIND